MPRRWTGLSDADGAATLTAFTAAAVARALAHLPAAPAALDRLRRRPAQSGADADACRTAGAPVEPVEAIGWDGDVIEAQAFAYLAVRSRRGLPLSWPGTTGAPAPLHGGRLFSRAS